MKQAFGIAVPQTLEDVCDRSRLALLVYDMQVGIVSQLQGADAVTARVARVLEASRRLTDDPARREAVADEMADVASYLLNLSNVLDIDLSSPLTAIASTRTFSICAAAAPARTRTACSGSSPGCRRPGA